VDLGGAVRVVLPQSPEHAGQGREQSAIHCLEFAGQGRKPRITPLRPARANFRGEFHEDLLEQIRIEHSLCF